MNIKQWFVRSSNKTKAGLLLVATFMMFGGLGFAMRPAQYNSGAAVQGASTIKSESFGSMNSREKASATVTKIEIETIEEIVPFVTTNTYDGTLPKDTTVVKVEGSNGKKVVRTEIRTRDGEVTRSLISETVTVPPVSKVVAIGTKIMPAKPVADKPDTCDRSETVRDTANDVAPNSPDEVPDQGGRKCAADPQLLE